LTLQIIKHMCHKMNPETLTTKGNMSAEPPGGWPIYNECS